MTVLSEYGLTDRDFEHLQALADGCCQRCGLPKERLVVDHDHAAGRHAVRGLVCYSCNQHLSRIDNGHRLPVSLDLAYFSAAWYLRHRPHIQPPTPRFGWKMHHPKQLHVNLRVPEKHMEVVREAAEEMELNQSDIIRLAVKEWVDRREEEK